MFPSTHFCIKLAEFHLYFPIYNLISEASPKNKVYFVDVQKTAVRVPAILKKLELRECLSQNFLMASLLPHCLRWKIVVCHGPAPHQLTFSASRRFNLLCRGP